MIPKIIHYCWFGGKTLDEMARKCIESWKKFCPDYKIMEWNETNFDIFINDYVKEAYSVQKWAFVSDYVRLYALYTHGGIYMDTDMELLENIDSFLNQAAFSGFEDECKIATAFMGSVKGGEWVKYLLSYYDNRHFIKADGTYDVTTNVITITNMTRQRYHIALNNSLQIMNGVLTLYPKDYFCPKSYQTGEINLTGNTVSIHHFNASWHDRYEKLLHDKRVYFIQKYGTQGEQKFQNWNRRNKLWIYIITHGIKMTMQKVLGKVLKRK